MSSSVEWWRGWELKGGGRRLGVDCLCPCIARSFTQVCPIRRYSSAQTACRSSSLDLLLLPLRLALPASKCVDLSSLKEHEDSVRLAGVAWLDLFLVSRLYQRLACIVTHECRPRRRRQDQETVDERERLGWSSTRRIDDVHNDSTLPSCFSVLSPGVCSSLQRLEVVVEQRHRADRLPESSSS
ncbi:hypothetical protein BJY59DRAFT_702832 [Rhodotorula toruloides]